MLLLLLSRSHTRPGKLVLWGREADVKWGTLRGGAPQICLFEGFELLEALTSAGQNARIQALVETVTWPRKAPCTANMFNPLLDAAHPQDPRNHADAEAGCCQDSKEFQNQPNILIHAALAWIYWCLDQPFQVFSTNNFLFHKYRLTSQQPLSN